MLFLRYCVTESVSMGDVIAEELPCFHVAY